MRRERAGLKNAITIAISGVVGGLYKTGKNLVDALLEDALLSALPLFDAI